MPGGEIYLAGMYYQIGKTQNFNLIMQLIIKRLGNPIEYILLSNFVWIHAKNKYLSSHALMHVASAKISQYLHRDAVKLRHTLCMLEDTRCT